MNTTKTKTFIFTAMLIATAITISCSSDGGDDGGNGGGNDLSSSGVETGSSSSAGTGDGSSSSGGTGGGGSSSSVGGTSDGGSSSSGAVSGSCLTIEDFSAVLNCPDYDPANPSNKGKFTDPRDNKEYNTIKICNQTWLAENLNYNAPGSKCYDDDPDNCDTYGRLYDWATAMDLDAKYNDEFYGVSGCLDYGSSRGTFDFWDPAVTTHQGVCPEGWRLPRSLELYWILSEAIGGREMAGTKLKATDGWDWYTYDDISGNGTDDYGFAALPGGSFEFNRDSFNDENQRGFWWSSSESRNNGVHILRLQYDANSSGWNMSDKKSFSSIRCVKN